MRGLFNEVWEFFAELFGRPKARYIGYLKRPSVENDKPSKRPKGQLGFRK